MTFSDGTDCELIAVQGTQLICLPEGFASGTTTATVTVTVNGQSLTYGTSLTVRSDPSKVLEIMPSSVSPVLKTPIKIIIGNYADPLVKSDLEIVLVSKGVTPPIVRPMNILELGTEGENQFIRAMFGGSESGVYDLRLRSKSYGRFDTTGITLTLVGKVTDFNPKEGSIHGG